MRIPKVDVIALEIISDIAGLNSLARGRNVINMEGDGVCTARWPGLIQYSPLIASDRVTMPSYWAVAERTEGCGTGTSRRCIYYLSPVRVADL